MNSKPVIDQLLETTPGLWQGRRFSRGQRSLPTGHARLDARLPGAGWPLGAVTELISGAPGLGELSLLLPVLATLGEQGQWVVLVSPPWIPYPASLQAQGIRLERLLLIRTRDERESLWACEQALRSGRGGAVLAWPESIDFARLRRLQLAAEANAKLAFLFRPENALRETSPAALRLLMEAGPRQETAVRVIKCRGRQPAEPAWIPRPFSLFGKPSGQTRTHDLASHPFSPPGPGPVYPGAERPQGSDRAQRRH
jgi:hypothetical protein